MPLTEGIILQLHRNLYKYSSGRSGIWKTQDNIIEEILPDGSKYRFKPVGAFSTPIYMSDLCARYREEIINEEVDDLVLISSFILDFLCIHPFNDGNGRMARIEPLALFKHVLYCCD
ncbi:Fic family protein [Clostridium argentinense]|uniref:Fic family protein n=1 Tax=Clostridium argentinense TaxID=29341 RepID=UPI0009B73510|nr:Fic family protein [Clostridium argentinense]NFF38211.1 Fic family protein [Clostridium argentinense]NFP49204.1 Fic family protein [Clostridium argentinense]NFP71516.1 Fic family protein [Clostridium argentinense]NFP75093.1 Fic family protein [Clostridium argentinense]